MASAEMAMERCLEIFEHSGRVGGGQVGRNNIQDLCLVDLGQDLGQHLGMDLDGQPPWDPAHPT